MNNFPFEYNGKTYWYSRSVVVGMFLFVYHNKQWYILANKRGVGCPCEIGKWNCPGGYLDFNEDIYQAADRECYEETGIHPANLCNIKCWDINSKPINAQNVAFKMYGKIKTSINRFMLTNKYSENNEVEDIKFIPISKINEYDWAFNHDKYIMKLYNQYINPSILQKIKNFFNKFI